MKRFFASVLKQGKRSVSLETTPKPLFTSHEQLVHDLEKAFQDQQKVTLHTGKAHYTGTIKRLLIEQNRVILIDSVKKISRFIDINDIKGIRSSGQNTLTHKISS